PRGAPGQATRAHGCPGKSREVPALRLAFESRDLPQRGFELLDLVLDSVDHAALEDDRDVLIQLAVLLLQCRHRDDSRGLDLAQMQHHVAQLTAKRPRLGDRFAGCHVAPPPPSPSKTAPRVASLAPRANGTLL